MLIQKLKENGFVFLKFNKNIKNYVYKINKIIKPYLKEIYSDKLKKENYAKLIFQIQTEINKEFSTEFFFKKNNQLFKKIFRNNKFSIQHYFYLRAVKSQKKKDLGPVNFHRETFQGPNFYKHCFNLWIPIRDCSKKNAIQYYPYSHRFKKNKDFNFVERWTKIKKSSFSHKTGSLYKEKLINFTKELYPKRLYKKNHLILFSGELIHGNATNLTNKIRISLDMRFMLKKFMRKNPIQSATKKKYFQQITL
jgi:ectoine hydroxylase-related dioxygenase (phytanoyl-CoA dioxygenase family)